MDGMLPEKVWHCEDADFRQLLRVLLDSFPVIARTLRG